MDGLNPARPKMFGSKSKAGDAYQAASTACAYIFAVAALMVIAGLIIYVR